MNKFVKVLLSTTLAAVLAIASPTSAFAYTVQPGDTLNDISAKYGISVDDIMARNTFIDDSHWIYPNQELDLGDGTKATKDLYYRAALSETDKAALASIFDVEYYRANNPDVIKIVGSSYAALWEHFLTYGLWETRQPNENFNVNAYISSYDDLIKAYKDMPFGERVKNATLHYIVNAKADGRTSTTIGSCLALGREVDYYGSYDCESKEWKDLHLIAAPLVHHDDDAAVPAPTPDDISGNDKKSGSDDNDKKPPEPKPVYLEEVVEEIAMNWAEKAGSLILAKEKVLTNADSLLNVVKNGDLTNFAAWYEEFSDKFSDLQGADEIIIREAFKTAKISTEFYNDPLLEELRIDIFNPGKLAELAESPYEEDKAFVAAGCPVEDMATYYTGMNIIVRMIGGA